MELLIIVLLRLEHITGPNDYGVTPTEIACRFFGPQPPPLRMAGYLPPAILARQNLTFNGAHRNWLEARDQMDGHGAYREWIRENDALRKIWDEIETAGNDNYCPWARRLAIGRVIALMGDDWNTQTYPPPAPFWRFREE